MCVYIYICVCIYIHIYIYIYRERERYVYVCLYICIICIYIYIYIYVGAAFALRGTAGRRVAQTISVYFTGRLHSPCACPRTLSSRGTGTIRNIPI